MFSIEVSLPADLELISQGAECATRLPVLCIHGGWHGAWCWQDNFLPGLAAAGYAAYALSLRGHGCSTGRARFASAAQYQQDIDWAVDQIRARSGQTPALLGHSMGGYLVQQWLQHHTAPGAVLLASIPPYGFGDFLLKFSRRKPLQMLKLLLTADTSVAVATPERAAELFFSATADPEVVQHCWDRLTRESLRIMLDASLLDLPDTSRINTPMLVLGAGNDAIFPPSHIYATAHAYGSEAIIFPHLAHDMMLDTGHAQVLQTIAEWLATLQQPLPGH